LTLVSGLSWAAAIAVLPQQCVRYCRYDHQQGNGYQQGVDSGTAGYPVKDYAHDGSKEFEQDPAAVRSPEAFGFVCESTLGIAASSWLTVSVARKA
jgi:hypothetical protein